MQIIKKKCNSTILTISGYQCVTAVLCAAYRITRAQTLRNERTVSK